MSSEMEYSAGESSLDSVTTRSQNMLSLRSRNVKRGKDGAKSEGNKTRNKHQPQQGKGKVVVNAARREMKRRRNLAKLKCRNISAERLKEAADMLQDPDHRIWKVPKSCNASIHRYYQKNNNSHIADHLRCLRQCLLRKDWRNLCRLLSIIPADPRYDFYYPVFFKYATICLAHISLEHLNRLTQSLVTNTADVPNALKLWSSLKSPLKKAPKT